MKVLVVYAHPNPGSFNHAILESFTKGLGHGGKTFEVIDLYAMKFNPSLEFEDYEQFICGPMPKDILDQQAKITQADGLAFVFPIWWLSCPAILKGWMDRVLFRGFAFKLTEKGPEGLLRNNKALIISTTGTPEIKLQASGRTDMMKKIFYEILTVDCGIASVEYLFLYGLDLVDDKTRKKYLDQVYNAGKEF